MTIHQDIRAYNKAQSASDKRICDALAKPVKLLSGGVVVELFALRSESCHNLGLLPVGNGSCCQVPHWRSTANATPTSADR